MYGDVAPSEALPFAVEEGGALGKQARQFVQWCIKRVRDDNPGFDLEGANWSNRGFSNWAFQPLSLANTKGLGHYFTAACACILDS